MKTKQKVRVILFKKDRSISRFLVTEQVLELDTRYSWIIVDDTPVELKPAFILMSYEKGEIIPVVLLDDKHRMLDPNGLFSLEAKE